MDVEDVEEVMAEEEVEVEAVVEAVDPVEIKMDLERRKACRIEIATRVLSPIPRIKLVRREQPRTLHENILLRLVYYRARIGGTSRAL